MHSNDLFPSEISLLSRVLDGEDLLDAPEDQFNKEELIKLEGLRNQGFVECDGIDHAPSRNGGYVPIFRGLRLSLLGRHALKASLLTSQQKIEPAHNLPNQTASSAKKYSVFISHAWEDKDEVARPLAKALENLGHAVWYDETTLKIGDSLRGAIDRGLSSSRYGVVILSKAFFRKNWPQYELDGLFAREQSLGKVILPLWHGVNREEVTEFSPILAGRIAAQTSLRTIPDLATEIHQVLIG